MLLCSYIIFSQNLYFSANSVHSYIKFFGYNLAVSNVAIFIIQKQYFPI
jgi:hypothetical protein